MPAPGTALPRTGIQAPARPAHRDGNVLRWLAAYTASVIGDSVYFLALGWAANQVGGPAEAGLVMAVGAVPRALLMLGGGVIADRVGPRRVVIGSDAIRCLVVLAVAAALALAAPGLWLLVTMALVFGVVDALFMPAVGALPPRITSPDQLVRVQGLRSLTVRAGTMAGPPLGGMAMAVHGPAAAFGVAGGLFAVSLALLLAVRIAPLPPDDTAGAAARPTPWQDLLDGLRHIRRHPLIGPLVLSGAISELGCAGPLNIGLVLLASDRGWGASGLGWIVSAFGAGAAVSALLLTVVGRLPRAGAVQICTLVVGSAALGSLGLAPSLPLAVGLAALSGLVCGVCGGLSFALVQAATAPAYLGRVGSVMSLTGLGIAPLSYPLFGAAVTAWGAAPVFLASGALSALGAAVGLVSPTVRRAELPRQKSVR
ncbi:MFS transporter [Streptomyces sp. H39-S7]|uniref:MFS transporter n=1 Tax=Streptomyces sp. H39-S7 TaxID=3004357 RepID=UPI0022B065FA|nr:MFS transporter [Streptomyces sp. H39-S7]MCZ4125625.1 MFS transporter [Streptomyces sp. H39-S7]